MAKTWALVAGILFVLAAPSPVGAKRKYPYLREVLQHFSEIRNQDVDPAAKEKARKYILDTFNDLGLRTWTEEFPRQGGGAPGINVIGTLPGKNAGTAKDNIALIGTHYDSVSTSPGVDDNGSGMTAMLTALRQFMSSNKMQCARNSTLYFVAFDLEERGLRGSEAFLKNFTALLNSTGAGFQGAVVLDTVMNYNTSENSQKLPQGFEQISQATYTNIQNDSFRGNFLTAIGRQDDARLLSIFSQSFDENDDYKMHDLTLPIRGRPSDWPAFQRTQMGDFLRSDHREFWDVDLGGIFLTDSADFRGYMKACYHKACDDMTKVTDEMVAFLGETTDALAKLASSLTEEKCNMKRTSGSTDLTADSGELLSPYYPDLYPNNAAVFLWKITPGADHVGLELTFEDFQLEASDNCSADYVQIYDHVEGGAKLVGSYCGTNSPGTVKAKGHALQVMFFSDHFVADKGFKAKWLTQPRTDSGAGIAGRTAWILTAMLSTAWTVISN